MLNVYVCEDNKEQREKYSKFIEDFIVIENLDMEFVLATEDPTEVVEKVKKQQNTGIYFLDVDLKSNINGINLAEQIREYDPRGFIVFITTHAEMSYLTFIYKVEAMDYIIKDNYNNIRDRIKQCIVNANNKHKANSTGATKIFTVKSDDKVINVEYKDILFFETSDTIHKIRLHGLNRQIEFYAQMKDIEDKLDERFIRCHRSFIVNRDYIKTIDKSNRIIYMINEEECYISTRGLKLLL